MDDTFLRNFHNHIFIELFVRLIELLLLISLIFSFLFKSAFNIPAYQNIGTRNLIFFYPLQVFLFRLFIMNNKKVARFRDRYFHVFFNIIGDINEINEILIRLEDIVLYLNATLAIFMNIIPIGESSFKQNI